MSLGEGYSRTELAGRSSGEEASDESTEGAEFPLPGDEHENEGDNPEPDQENQSEAEQEAADFEVPDVESLKEETPDLKQARVKYLKGQRLRGKMIRGEKLQKVFEWFGDTRSVTITENGSEEEMFFGHKNGEQNLRRLRDRYEEKFKQYRESKIKEFLLSLPDDISPERKEEAITEFAVNLMEADQKNRNEAYQSLDESFDDKSFRDWWRTDSMRKKRKWASRGLLAGGIGAGIATAGTASAAAALARGGLAGAGAFVAAEEQLEKRTSLSRTGGLTKIKSYLEGESTPEEIDAAINRYADHLYEDISSGSELDQKINRETVIKNEMSRLRMLANDMGVSVQEAAVNSDDITADIVSRMQEREREILANNALDRVGHEVSNTENEDEAVNNALMEAFADNEKFINDKMEEENDLERSKKIYRRILAGVTGGSVGWFIGSGTMGRAIGKLGSWLFEDAPPMPELAEDETIKETIIDKGEVDLDQELPLDSSAGESVAEVDIAEWSGSDTYGDETQARSFIEAVGDIKDQMTEVDASGNEGMENLKEFLAGDTANNLSEVLEGYNPEDIKESLVVEPGESLRVTEEGNLLLEHSDGSVDTLFDGAKGEVNPDVFSDDAFGDFDDVSGDEQPTEEAVDQTGDTTQQDFEPDNDGSGAYDDSIQKASVAGMDTGPDPIADNMPKTDDLELPASVGQELSVEDAAQVIEENYTSANGAARGAIESYLKDISEAGYEAGYIENIQLPEGMSESEFARHIKNLNRLEEPLTHVRDMAQEHPARLKAFQALFDGYSEVVDDNYSPNLQTLHDSVSKYLESGGPDLDSFLNPKDADQTVPGADGAESPGSDGASQTVSGSEGEGSVPDAGSESSVGAETSEATQINSVSDLESMNLTNDQVWPLSDSLTEEQILEIASHEDAHGKVFRQGDDLYVYNIATSKSAGIANSHVGRMAQGDFLQAFGLGKAEISGLDSVADNVVELDDGRYRHEALYKVGAEQFEAQQPGGGAGESGITVETGENAPHDQPESGRAEENPKTESEPSGAESQEDSESQDGQESNQPPEPEPESEADQETTPEGEADTEPETGTEGQESAQMNTQELQGYLHDSDLAAALQAKIEGGEIGNGYPVSLSTAIKVAEDSVQEGLYDATVNGQSLLNENEVDELVAALDDSGTLTSRVASLVNEDTVNSIASDKPNHLRTLAILADYHQHIGSSSDAFSNMSVEVSPEAITQFKDYINTAIRNAGGTPPTTPWSQ